MFVFCSAGNECFRVQGASEDERHCSRNEHGPWKSLHQASKWPRVSTGSMAEQKHWECDRASQQDAGLERWYTIICAQLPWQGHPSICQKFSDHSWQWPGLHCDAVWSCSRGRLYNGLQLPHVCPAGICYCSVQFWQQASLWVAISHCQPQEQKDLARLLYSPNHWVKGRGEIQSSWDPLSRSSIGGMTAYRVCFFVRIWLSKVAFLLFKKGHHSWGKAQRLQSSTVGVYQKRMHSFNWQSKISYSLSLLNRQAKTNLLLMFK